MVIFYITYWGFEDGLSVSTSRPILRLLAERDDVDKIFYFTVERQDINAVTNSNFDECIPKTQHIPIFSIPLFWRPITKFFDIFRIYQMISSVALKNSPDLIICRGSITAMFGYWLHSATRVPYIIESFEPHADYMHQSGVWHRYGLSYIIESHYEEQAKNTSTALITVSYNYYRQLVDNEQIPSGKIYVVPCTVQIEVFDLNPVERSRKRTELAISVDDRVGIYVGKFGSIYYDIEAFDIFKATYNFYNGKFKLIILTPTPVNSILADLRRVDFPLDQVYISCVPHHEVPTYLAVADFAFSLIRPAPSRRYCSPIKDGEYWAAGLPILITDGVGDDSDIIRDALIGGAIFDVHCPLSIIKALTNIESQIQKPTSRQLVRQLAITHRHFDIQRNVYAQIFDSLFADNEQMVTRVE